MKKTLQSSPNVKELSICIFWGEWQFSRTILVRRVKFYKILKFFIENYLSKGLALCHVNYKKVIRKIMQFLVPVRILKGKIPSKKILEDLKLYEYVNVI